MAPAWRIAASLLQLRAEVNTRWAARDKRSDGAIGDAEHASRNSDHNPWVLKAGVGVVRAVDIDKDFTGPATDARPTFEAVEANWLAEYVRALGKAGDPRLVGGGYVIWNRRIASEASGWAWKTYSGENAHMHHVHVSVTRNLAAFDSTASWGIWPPPPAPDTTTDFLEGLMAQLNDAEKNEFMRFVRTFNRTWDQRTKSKAVGHENDDMWQAEFDAWTEANTSRAAAASEKTNELLRELIDLHKEK